MLFARTLPGQALGFAPPSQRGRASATKCTFPLNTMTYSTNSKAHAHQPLFGRFLGARTQLDEGSCLVQNLGSQDLESLRLGHHICRIGLINNFTKLANEQVQLCHSKILKKEHMHLTLLHDWWLWGLQAKDVQLLEGQKCLIV